MSETAQSESRSEDSAAGKTDGEIKAIAAETEIAAIEEGGKQGTGEVGNPADRRLPLIVRIYGIVMLIEGVVTLPFIVLACLYSIRAVFSGKVAFDALSLTAILSVVHAAVLLVAAVAGGFALFAPLHLAGAIYGDAGWVGALSPAGGAALMVLVAYAAALSGSTRATTLVVMLVWLFFALIWDPNTASMPALQRGLPLLVLLAVGACAWRALGSPERVWRKLGGAR